MQVQEKLTKINQQNQEIGMSSAVHKYSQSHIKLA